MENWVGCSFFPWSILTYRVGWGWMGVFLTFPCQARENYTMYDPLDSASWHHTCCEQYVIEYFWLSLKLNKWEEISKIILSRPVSPDPWGETGLSYIFITISYHWIKWGEWPFKNTCNINLVTSFIEGFSYLIFKNHEK